MLAEVSPLSVAIFALEIVFAMSTNSAAFASFLATTLFNTVDTNAPSLAYLAVVFLCTMLAHGSLFPLCLCWITGYGQHPLELMLRLSHGAYAYCALTPYDSLL